MGTWDVVDALQKLPLLSFIGAVDLADRLSFIATCVLLIAGSLVVTLREYLMDPIACYLTVNPGGENFLKYVEHFCWTEGTMSITDHYKIPQTEKDWQSYLNSRIIYYQWVPFMLLFQCALFYAPQIFWTFLCSFLTGFNVTNFLSQDLTSVKLNLSAKPKPNSPSSDQHSDQSETKSENALLNDSKSTEDTNQSPQTFSKFSVTLLRLFIQHRDYNRNNKFYKVNKKLFHSLKIWPSKRFNSKLTFFYFFTKCLYILNSIGQIFLMQSFLQLDSVIGSYSSWFGIELLHDLLTGKRWPQTGAFPRSAYCMVRVTTSGNHRNTQVAQCVLTANMFIEKIYVFLWFWILVVVIFSICSFLVWVVRIFTGHGRETLQKYLELQGADIKSVSNWIKFRDEFLGNDGVFLIYMVYLNRGDLVAAPIVEELYRMWNILEAQKGDEDTKWTGALKNINVTDVTKFV